MWNRAWKEREKNKKGISRFFDFDYVSNMLKYFFNHFVVFKSKIAKSNPDWVLVFFGNYCQSQE